MSDDTASYSTRGLTYDQRRELQSVPEWLRPTWTRWARQANATESGEMTVHATFNPPIAEDLVRIKGGAKWTHVVTAQLRRNEGGTSFEKFRVTVRRDFYDFQSWAKVEVWRRDGWTLVHALEGEDPRVVFLPQSWVSDDDAGACETYGDLSSTLIDVAIEVVA